MAIIKNVGFGMRDCAHPVLWFDTYTSEGSGALQVFSYPKSEEIIKQAGVYDVHGLEGKPCWVEEADGMIFFLSIMTIEN